jgi:hypothetical protein
MAEQDAHARIIGTWALVSVLYEDAESGERTPVYGQNPKGCQIATPEGRWLALMTAEGRTVPETDAERAAALRSMIAYTGRWRIDGDQVATVVEAAWNQSWVGTEQRRTYRFDGDLLNLESPLTPHPNLLGRMVRIIVTWRREA